MKNSDKRNSIRIYNILWLVMTINQRKELCDMVGSKDFLRDTVDDYIVSLMDLYDIPTKVKYEQETKLYKIHLTSLMMSRGYTEKDIYKMKKEWFKLKLIRR